MFGDLSHGVCEESLSRSSALAARCHDLIAPAGPASEHTAAVPRYHAPLALGLRLSASAATVARGTARRLANARPARCVPPPARAYPAAPPWQHHDRWGAGGRRALGAAPHAVPHNDAIDVQVCFWQSRRPVGVPNRFPRSSAQRALTPCRDAWQNTPTLSRPRP